MSFRITYRCYFLSSACRSNHYETLGVSPKATHAEIKSAYYKLSMRFHPDRQDGNREQFEKINNAYKVLGDHANRGLYDRGAFQDSPSPPVRNYYARSSPQMRRPDVPSGKTPIYDFDMWSRLHYGKTMERRSTAKAKYKERMDEGSFSKSQAKKENVTMSVFTAIMLTGLASYCYNKMFESLDKTPNGKE
uniref:Chaperone protein DnaJ n=1 Tax=Lygus hesperus TaxID=30085 RepID=A0A0A9YJ90_LYGHE